MKKINNSSGLTLVEVLAVIAILSIVTVLIISISSTGFKISKNTETNAFLHQEANYIISVLNKLHKQNKNYEILIENDDQKLTIKNDSETITISEKQFVYYLYIMKDNEELTNKDGNEITKFTINPLEQKTLNVRIEIESSSGEQYEIITTLSRL
ncbi:type II secretion system protein [Ureibacillus manganicus]|uniref:Prepilin-type N-terminal cleavage/methylation domain-containing protein n=1 Tax=Ureibacillus manganicus DSM 26584 TaxID=1384049 RepID=A0A0A3I806_9BACL|nr:type II secretion system protein [Ureibacillus manganicus]KGR79650.1 hypothetical protein CD29_06010 [Ureibacillus manganicus DSM 26584]